MACCLELWVEKETLKVLEKQPGVSPRGQATDGKLVLDKGSKCFFASRRVRRKDNNIHSLEQFCLGRGVEFSSPA